MRRATIVLPTYNEAENIKPVLEQIFKQKTPGWKITVLVVDDNSPDGTSAIVEQLQKKYSSLSLLKGTKQGLGVAYTRGFAQAQKKYKPEVIFEMDADLSHPPKMIPEFLKEVEKGADFVIGSRYVRGGGTPDFTLFRKLNSRVANVFARFVAGMHKVKDCTSGYRAIKTSIIKKIDFEALGAKGYSFQQNLLYEALQQGIKVAEIPLMFYQRTKGESKMRVKDMAEFIKNSLRLGFRTWKRFIKFCIVGGSGVIVNMGVLYALTELLSVEYKISSIFAIQTAIITNFAFNNAWTFNKSTNKSPLLIKFAKFEAISIVGAVINWGVLVGLTELAGIYYILSNLIGIIIATVWNYTMNVFYTWKNEKKRE
jgi:dolichol-phosphate mannosyltransferase